MQRHVPVDGEVGSEPVTAVDELRDVEEAFGAEEVSVSWLGGAEHRRQQRRLVLIDDVPGYRGQVTEAGELSALLCEADRRGECLEDGRLAAPVFSSQE